MSQRTDVFGLVPETLFIPLGATSALLLDGDVGQVGSVLNYISGGTLWIMGVTGGQTLTAAQLASDFNGATLRFNVQSGQAINIDGAPRFYLAATGATVVCQLLRGLGTPGGYAN